MANVIQAVTERNFVAQSVNARPELLSPSYLRSEVALAASASYQFLFTKTAKTSNVIATDQLLNNTDAFVVTAISFGLRQINASTPTAAQQGIAILYQFNNVKVFTQSNDANMQAIYNGYCTVTLDNVQVAPAIPMRAFERVGTAQQGVVTAAITGTSYTQGRDELPYSTYGDMPITPLMLNGTSKFDITAYLGGGPQTITTASYTNYAVFMLRGFLVSNKS